MKKKTYVLGMAVLVAALLAMAGVAQSAMWVGAELGANIPLNADVKIGTPFGNGTISNVGFRASVLGGMAIGYDFVNSGFGAANYPDWMKYFSFFTDVTYNKLNISPQTINILGPGGVAAVNTTKTLHGYEVAWSFMFMAHFGFLGDSEVPSGRINPYLAVGPALLFSGLGDQTGTNVALVVEPGVRFMCLKNVSIDTAMRWRYAAPSYDLAGNSTAKISSFNQFTFLVRANYHF
jgi:hypothetical protein